MRIESLEPILSRNEIGRDQNGRDEGEKEALEGLIGRVVLFHPDWCYFEGGYWIIAKVTPEGSLKRQMCEPLERVVGGCTIWPP